MNVDVTVAVADFLAHKRALGRKYQTEEATLCLLVGFTGAHGVSGLRELTAPLLEEFVASRPRHRARSFNHLVGVVGGFLDWTVAQGRLQASPLQKIRRRETDERLPFIFDTHQVRSILEAADALADNPRARNRAMIHRTIFALCYGLGLRAREACNLRVGDVDTDRQLIVVRGGKFGKSRLVPHGPRNGELLTRRLHDCSDDPADALFSFDGRAASIPALPAACSTRSSPSWTSQSRTG
jgi:integrase